MSTFAILFRPPVKTARIRRMPAARRPWLVTVRSDGIVRPGWPRSYHTFDAARTIALAEVGLTEKNTEKEEDR